MFLHAVCPVPEIPWCLFFQSRPTYKIDRTIAPAVRQWHREFQAMVSFEKLPSADSYLPRPLNKIRFNDEHADCTATIIATGRKNQMGLKIPSACLIEKCRFRHIFNFSIDTSCCKCGCLSNNGIVRFFENN